MILNVQRELASVVQAAARKAGAELPNVAFQYPPRVEMGDLALTTPFDLAKSLRRKPREIAEILTQELVQAPEVRRAEVAGGGYVNIFLHRGAFATRLHDLLRQPPVPAPRPGHVIVEHTSINPNKAAHIGHLRNAVLGDTFVRVLRFLGHDVGVQNYIDDTGVQVADVVVGFLYLEKKSLADVKTLIAQEQFDYYCWDLYARVGEFYAQDPANKALQAKTLHQIEAGGNDTAELGEVVADAIVACHLRTMNRLGIRYDLLAHESDILRLHFWDRAFDLLKQKGAIRLETEGKSAGCWVLSMESEGADEDKIIVRSNGTVTYTGKDIAYQLWKLGLLDRDFHYRRVQTDPDGHPLWTTTSNGGDPGAPAFGHARDVYNVIDVGQSYPQRVVKAGVAALGHREGAEGTHHLAYEKVVLSPATARALGYAVSDDEASVKVSGRKGLGVKADDLIDALIAKAEAEITARDDAREAAARTRTATEIATGALRYFLLKFGRTKIITFDMEEALAFTGETGPYVQNGIVRARNILAKLREAGHDPAALVERARALDLDTFLSTEEGDEVWSLLVLMARSEEVFHQTVRAEELSLVAKQAFGVAQAFHSYYQKGKYSVLHAESEDLRAFRTLVVDAFLRHMEALTTILGIPIPERM
jgi:arginyl-tRNA synthetase